MEKRIFSEYSVFCCDDFMEQANFEESDYEALQKAGLWSWRVMRVGSRTTNRLSEQDSKIPLNVKHVLCAAPFCKMTSTDFWESVWGCSRGLWECNIILTSHWEIVRAFTSSHSHENISRNLETFLMECFAETSSRISGICVQEGIGDFPQQARLHRGAPHALLARYFCDDDMVILISEAEIMLLYG